MLHNHITKSISEQDKLALETNHNYFVRTAIVDVAKLILASLIYAAITIVCSYIAAASATTSAVSKAASDASQLSAVIGFVSLIYLVYFIVIVGSLISLYKNNQLIENNILGSTPTKNVSSASAKNNNRDQDQNQDEDDL